MLVTDKANTNTHIQLVVCLAYDEGNNIIQRVCQNGTYSLRIYKYISL